MSISMDPQNRQAFLNAIALRPLNWEICRAVSYAIWCCTEIEIDIRYPLDRNSSGRGVVYIQQTAMTDTDRASEFLNYICSNARVITKFKMNVEVSDTKMADALINAVMNGKKVQLEEIRVRRRYVGQQFPLLADLIRMHSESLRVVGKLGLSEALQAFNDKIHLDRFSLINFDLIQNGQMESEQLAESTRFGLRRLAGLGATFEHLSYSTYSGFEISKQPAIHLLKSCRVKSIRLTQQKGIAISDPPVVRALLPDLRQIELVGCMEVTAKHMDALFPKLESFHLQKVDLVTGAASANRVSRPVSAEINRERQIVPLNFAIAAC
ncbi:hypothetical protein Ddc_01351 [Ditylenchus destructor]|nr:hypothetical protein Ddc_01351 [Ditylenchus destructor]